MRDHNIIIIISQLISQTTRPISYSILNLLIPSSPNLIEDMQSVPGISDHLVIIFDANFKLHIPKKPIRKVYQFYKAGKISLNMNAEAVLDNFFSLILLKNTLILTGVVSKAF